MEQLVEKVESSKKRSSKIFGVVRQKPQGRQIKDPPWAADTLATPLAQNPYTQISILYYNTVRCLCSLRYKLSDDNRSIAFLTYFFDKIVLICHRTGGVARGGGKGCPPRAALLGGGGEMSPTYSGVARVEAMGVGCTFRVR